MHLIAIVLNIIILLAIAFIFYKSFSSDFKIFYWPGLAFKILGGICLGLIYFYYYRDGDTIGYLIESKKIANVFYFDALQYLKILYSNLDIDTLDLHFTPLNNPRAFWFCKVTSIFMVLSDNNYWIACCYLSLISFVGTYFLCENLNKLYPAKQVTIAISFLFFPSFVFWSAGFLKESLAITALFYMVAIGLKFVNREKINKVEIVLVFVSFWIEWHLRFFYLAVFLLTFGFYIFYVLMERKSSAFRNYKLFLLPLALILTIFLISKLHYSINFSNILWDVWGTYLTEHEKNPANAINYVRLEGLGTNIFINSPLALTSGLFRPSIFDLNSKLLLPVALENFFLVILFLSGLKNFKKLNTLEIVMWVYVLILATALALVSPNFGTLTRHKVGFLPFLLFLLLKDNAIMEKIEKKIKRTIRISISE